ncbi:hypothetical protein ACWKWP_00865 [Agromyces soli]
MSFSPGRAIGIVVGSVAILGIGVYGPAMLLGPLPDAEIVPVTAMDAPAAGAAALALPVDGASAAVLLSDGRGDEAAEADADASGDANTDADGSAPANDDAAADPESVIATAGATEALPIGAAAKLVTVLVTLDALPVKAGEAGAALTIGPEDYTEYLRLDAEGSRTLPVLPGEHWSERDVVRAVLLASSNNHADTLARWAFGSIDAYTDRANIWLEEQGFASLRVDDASGLSGDSVGTAEEVARLAALALANPVIAAAYDEAEAAEAAGGPATGGSAGTTPPAGRDIPDVVDHAADDGARALVRGYTDQAGLVFVYRTQQQIEGADAPVEVVVAMVRMPDYETLDPAVAAFASSLAGAATPIEVISKGESYGTARTAWGDEADLVAAASRTAAQWGAAPGAPELDVAPFTTGSSGSSVGKVRVPVAGESLAAELELSNDLRDPGPLWRLTNPATLIAAFVDGQRHAG